MDLKNLNKKQKTAIAVGGGVVIAAAIWVVSAMSKGTPTAPKLKITGVDSARNVHYTINGISGKVPPITSRTIDLGEGYKLWIFSEAQPDGSRLIRFLHTEKDFLRIISELGSVHV